MQRIKEIISRPQVWGFLLSMAILAIISLAFFYPDNFEGNSLRQPDMQQGAANGHEAEQYEAATGEKALWTNSLFGGMPTFQISPSYPSNSLFTWLNTVYGLGLPAPSNLLFMMMFGFLILLFTLRLRWYYALIGAVAWGLSSYFIIIIGAGHIWKFLALSYVPPTIAGFLLLYRGRRVVGTAMLALFAMLQLNANHPQMTYYFGLVMGLLAICYLIDALRRGKLRQWLYAGCLALLAGALAIGANAPSLYNTYEYAKETKRSQSELTPTTTAETSDDSGDRPTGGMPKEQIVGWSYGRSEMFSLLVPNIKGGASARPEGGSMVATSLAQLEDAVQYTRNAPLLEYMSQYFNDSEGTNGPVYVGIIVFALFLAGCFIVGGPLKWGLVAATIMSVILALGRNAEGITDFMIYHFPLYNKFRAVESILVIAEFTMPLLAIMALSRLVEAGKEAWTSYRTGICVGFGVPVAICLLALVAPGVFGGFITDNDRATSERIQEQLYSMGKQQGASDDQIAQYIYMYSLSNPDNSEAITSLRKGMVRDDALRSFWLLLALIAALMLYWRGTLKEGYAVAFIGVLVLFDLYGVDKRYVNHSSFGPADSEGGHIVFTTDAIDNRILADTTSHYRVFDLPGFYRADRSYFHKTLGGYHAAKLNRYEDIIQRRLGFVASVGGWFDGDSILDRADMAEAGAQLKAGYKVANMLNAKYIITGDPAKPLIVNGNAMGNAWLVDEIEWVDGADAEMAALDADIDLRRTAVADNRFRPALPQAPTLAPGDTIYLTSYTPNTLTYHASTAHGGIGVFSEVYFPWGWHADVDGTEVPVARVNYLLRAVPLPAGSHTVTMTFAPESIRTTSTVAYICVTLIYLIVLAGIFIETRRCRFF